MKFKIYVNYLAKISLCFITCFLLSNTLINKSRIKKIRLRQISFGIK